MSQEQFDLNWHTYSDHLRELMETLMNTNKSADVTLICNDKTKFRAHKFVLSACSPVFQSIIDELPNKDGSCIYLRGVESKEMKSILQFMYLGQATIYQDRMNEFLDVAKSLEIKEISKDVECDDVDAFKGQESDEISQVDNETDVNCILINQNCVSEEIGKMDTKVSGYKDKTGQYQCGKCEKQFSIISNLNRHSRSAHEGIRYPCNKCNQTFTLNATLKIHIQSIHEGQKFPCDVCHQVYAHKSKLSTHKKMKH